ncbi:hypothetical protein BGV18_19450 [Clostridioides difficile]|nr:hypothetical protein BGV18_19450 [Clostridioides difficile]
MFYELFILALIAIPTGICTGMVGSFSYTPLTLPDKALGYVFGGRVSLNAKYVLPIWFGRARRNTPAG